VGKRFSRIGTYGLVAVHKTVYDNRKPTGYMLGFIMPRASPPFRVVAGWIILRIESRSAKYPCSFLRPWREILRLNNGWHLRHGFFIVGFSLLRLAVLNSDRIISANHLSIRLDVWVVPARCAL